MAKQNIQVDVPFAIGTEVYKKSDLRVLEEHAASYNELVLYQVVGYEVAFDSATAEAGRAIITYKTIGSQATSFPKRFYVHPGLLVENNNDISTKVGSIAGLIFPATATTEQS